MNTLNFTVKANHLELSDTEITTQGSVNYDECVFSFDSEWDGYEKTAVFSKNKTEFCRVNLVDDKCHIPSVCLECDGYIKIGVYGISPDDSVIISTNTVAHYVNEGVEKVGEWMEADNDMVFNAVKELNEYAEEFTEKLNLKFDEFVEKAMEEIGKDPTSQPDDSENPDATVQPVDLSLAFTDDWFEPERFDRINQAPQSTGAVEPDTYLAFLFDPLVDDFPDYVTKEQIGTDSTGTYPIYSYTFTPKKYEKTVFITSFLHGTDRISYVALGYFLDLLCRKTDSSNILSYIKSKVKLVTIPLPNPYGAKDVRTANGSDVELPLNFPYNWDSISGRKGASAGDQSETKAIISLLKTLSNDKLCAVIDLHTNNTLTTGCCAYYPRARQECSLILTEIIKKMFVGSTDVLYSTSVLAPTTATNLMNYAADTHGVDACELLWPNMTHGGITSNLNVTRFTKFIGNTIFKMAKNSRTPYYLPPTPFIKHYTWTKSNDDDIFIIPNTGALDEMRLSAVKFKINSAMAIMLSGFVTVKTPSECSLTIKPIFSQKNSPTFSHDNVTDMNAFATTVELSPGTHVIPINAALQAYFSNTFFNEVNYYQEVELVLAGICDSADAEIHAYSITLFGVPCASSSSVEISRPLGLATDYTGSDVPTQELIYPTGEYSESDGSYYD